MAKQLAGEQPVLPDSVWRLTAPDLPACGPLQENRQADVAVVGAGFTGLMAALTLRAAGRSVVVVDATEPGWGASGRNNGQVIPGFKWDPDQIVERYGAAQGEKLVAWGGDAPGVVFDTIARHGIECFPVRKGWIQPAMTDVSVATIRKRLAQWERRGAPVSAIPDQDLARTLGTPVFKSGWIDRRGGSINPLAYARGLAAAALRQGVELYTYTPALEMARTGTEWAITCANGVTVRAPQVVVATAAYANDMVPGLNRAMIPVRTAQVATAPLPRHMLEAILPDRQCASDTRRLLTSFRISPDNRLVMGGSGATAGLQHDYIVTRLHAAAGEMFRHLGQLPWELAWSGFFAVTKDHMPHIHETGDGVICALGCNGRGIGISTAMGQLLGERLLGKDARDMPLPPTPMQRFHFHAFRHLGVATATQYYGLRDKLDLRSTT
jgi:glycine/D-amino acid oxidase-like deaminating enzyme